MTFHVRLYVPNHDPRLACNGVCVPLLVGMSGPDILYWPHVEVRSNLSVVECTSIKTTEYDALVMSALSRD
jgi:hypothetical protein